MLTPMSFLSLVVPSSFLLATVHRHWLPFRLPFLTQPVLALIAGLLILIRPKFLNFIVAVYLIIVGLIGIFDRL